MTKGLQNSSKTRVYYLLLVMIGLLFILFSRVIFADEEYKLVVSFPEGSNSFEPQQYQAIAKFALIALAGHKFVVIKDRRFGLVDHSLAALQTEARSLRVFKSLVENAVPPDHIRIESSADKPESNSVTLSFEDREAAANEYKNVSPIISDEDSTQYIVYFEKRSAQPLFKKESILELVSSLNEPSTHSISIEGFTDADGSAAYNQIISDLRALAVFRYLTIAGVKPKDINVFGRGIAREIVLGNNGRDVKEEQRRVLITWSVEPSLPDPQPEPVLEEKTAPDFTYEISPFAGMLVPLGELAKHAMPAVEYGLRVGLIFNLKKSRFLRAGISSTAESNLVAKESDRTGPLKLHITSLTADYLFSSINQVLLLGGGVDFIRWSATIVQPSTDLSNTGGKTDPGIQVRGGIIFPIAASLRWGPTLSVHKVFGSLNESFLATLLNIYWEI